MAEKSDDKMRGKHYCSDEWSFGIERKNSLHSIAVKQETIIHYITKLATKEDLDFGATKVEMELRHWHSA